jgi:hypothetical protein
LQQTPDNQDWLLGNCQAVGNSEVDRSIYTTVIEDIKALMKVRHVCITHVKKCQYISSYYLANYARTNGHTTA